MRQTYDRGQVAWRLCPEREASTCMGIKPFKSTRLQASHRPSLQSTLSSALSQGLVKPRGDKVAVLAVPTA